MTTEEAARRKCESAHERAALEQLLAARLLDGCVQQYAWGAHRGRLWTFDFAWPDERVALEIDGGKRMVTGGRSGRRVVGGRHNSDADLDRQNAAMLEGWCVLRATPAMLKRAWDYPDGTTYVARLVGAALQLARRRAREKGVRRG
jgi:very-short-patch-repair endonuclease